MGRLSGYLDDLSAHRGRAAAEIAGDPYELERLLELIVQVAVDMLSHVMAERGASPESYRASFELAGEQGLLPTDLASRLARAAGLRNILVHLYEDIDYAIIATSVNPAIDDFGAFIRHLQERLPEPSDCPPSRAALPIRPWLRTPHRPPSRTAAPPPGRR